MSTIGLVLPDVSPCMSLEIVCSKFHVFGSPKKLRFQRVAHYIDQFSESCLSSLWHSHLSYLFHVAEAELPFFEMVLPLVVLALSVMFSDD